MTDDFGKWIKEDAGGVAHPECNEVHARKVCDCFEVAVVSLAAQLYEVAKGYMEWEADMVLDSGVWLEDGLPHLTQHLQDKLMVLQGQRTAALVACKEFMEKYDA